MVDRKSLSDTERDFGFVDEHILALAQQNWSTVLPDDFTPNNWSVICGRGKQSHSNSTYEHFQQAVNQTKTTLAHNMPYSTTIQLETADSGYSVNSTWINIHALDPS
jgi:hypothetical protein